jgi:hypothetical protein
MYKSKLVKGLNMKRLLWKVLLWIDNNINHPIVEERILLLPHYDTRYFLWKHVCNAFCDGVTIDLVDAWDIDYDQAKQ